MNMFKLSFPGFRVWALALALLGLQGCSSLAPEAYQPKLGQPGKDVMWLPTRDDLVTRMLETAKVTKDDVVYDLGAGDGKIPIAAATQFGARAVGIEYNRDLAGLATRNSQRAGVADRVKIIHGDIFKEDFSSATVLTLYLLEELNFQLRPLILKMRPGTRVLSNTFSMGDWEPDQVISVNSSTGYFWTVPAQVGGTWTLSGLDSLSGTGGQKPVVLTLTQKYQRLAGTLRIGSATQALLGATLQGQELRFSFLNDAGDLKSVRLAVDGPSLKGEVVGPYGMLETPHKPVAVEGRRAPS